MKWITREKVKVDRVACPWLIQNFVDPQAEFIFVPAYQVEAKARELGATPFDIEGCEPGHHGEDVSFNSILKKCNLTDPALVLLGEIVRACLVRDCIVTLGSFLGAWLWSLSPQTNFIGAAVCGALGTLWFWWSISRGPTAQPKMQFNHS